jgi:hypothetical protein
MQDVESRVSESRRKEVSAYCDLQAAVDLLGGMDQPSGANQQDALATAEVLVDSAEIYLRGEAYHSWLNHLERALDNSSDRT